MREAYISDALFALYGSQHHKAHGGANGVRTRRELIFSTDLYAYYGGQFYFCDEECPAGQYCSTNNTCACNDPAYSGATCSGTVTAP